jgi:hypothetical protein
MKLCNACDLFTPLFRASQDVATRFTCRPTNWQRPLPLQGVTLLAALCLTCRLLRSFDANPEREKFGSVWHNRPRSRVPELEPLIEVASNIGGKPALHTCKEHLHPPSWWWWEWARTCLAGSGSSQTVLHPPCAMRATLPICGATRKTRCHILRGPL